MQNRQPKTVLDILSTFHLFKEKAAKLRASPFTKQLGNLRWGYHVDDTTGDFRIEDIRPDDVSREALILTLRFFVQDSDGLKLKKIVKLYNGLPIPETVKQSVANSLKAFEEALASGLQINVDGTIYKSDRLFTIFMYGQYCHATKSNRDLFNRLRQCHPLTWVMLNQEFDKLVALHLEYIFWLDKKIAIALRALEATSPSSSCETR
jgi:hypothetical protein